MNVNKTRENVTVQPGTEISHAAPDTMWRESRVGVWLMKLGLRVLSNSNFRDPRANLERDVLLQASRWCGLA
jgi:hypothetical protein